MHCSKQPHHSITSSAVAISVVGTVRPSDFAVLRLMTNANLVGYSTGISAGFVPRRILDVFPFGEAGFLQLGQTTSCSRLLPSPARCRTVSNGKLIGATKARYASVWSAARPSDPPGTQDTKGHFNAIAER